MPPAHPPIPRVIMYIIAQLNLDPDNRACPVSVSGLVHKGPTLPCFTMAQIKIANAAIVIMTEDITAGIRYLVEGEVHCVAGRYWRYPPFGSQEKDGE